MPRGPAPRPRPGPTLFTLSRPGGGQIFLSSVFAGIEDFTVFGWRSLLRGTAPGPRQGPPPSLPYLDRSGGGGKISHLAFFQDIKISQFLELARVPSPRAQAGPTAFTLSHRGGQIFPSSVFAGIEDFKVFGWRSLPGGTAPGPMQGPPPPLPYFDCWGGAKFPV